MFFPPNAKCVRRSELEASFSPPPSEPDAELEAVFRASMARFYGALETHMMISHSAPAGGAAEQEREAEEQIYSFRLLKSEGEAVVQKIVLRDEEEDVGEGGFIKMNDPRVFVVGRAEGKSRVRFESVAVSGEEVLCNAEKRAWGLEVPWRVRVVRIVEKKKKRGEGGDVVIQVEEDDLYMKKKRPGKKRRIILRERKKVRDEMVERKRIEAASKEEAERDKKTRRNREKKVKKRMKEKAMKEVGSVGASHNVDVGNALNSPTIIHD